jgi:two-component system phosphate regulon sensor histidine kinase PhoR
MFPPRWRTFWRLFGTHAALVLTSLVVLGWVLVDRVEEYELEQIKQHLQRQAVLLDSIVADYTPSLAPLLKGRVRSWGERMDVRITLICRDGKVIADSAEDADLMENHAERPEVLAAREDGQGTSIRYSQTVGESMMYVALRCENGPVAYIRVARPLDHVQQQVQDLGRIVWSFVGITAIAVLLVAYGVSRRITRPLQELTVSADRIAAGDYDCKVYAVGSDEIGVLARAFNTMSERLAGQFQQLEHDRQQLRTVLSGMVEGVVAIDAGQRILFANDRAGELLNFSQDRVVGRKLWEVVRQRAIQEVIQKAAEQAEPYRAELDGQDGAFKSLAVYVARLPGSPPLGAVLVLQDTTELRRLERMRRDFVANVSHELKTPLSVIKVCVETLLDGAIDDIENRTAFLEQIEEQGNRLHALILDLLSLARIESGAEVFDFKPVRMGPLIRECLERHRARAEAKSQVLETLSTNGTGEVVAWADEEAVAQILDNLIDNAVKYTPVGGRIQVRCRAEAGQVCLEVEDSGIGIPERDLPRVFERFYRVDKARSRELGGTGLGLSIVKHLVQAMNGTVTAASQLNRGSTFTIRLPSAQA